MLQECLSIKCARCVSWYPLSIKYTDSNCCIKATQSPVLAEDFEFYDLDALYRVPPYQEFMLVNSVHGELDDSLRSGRPLPSMMLTLPTPEIPTFSAFNPGSISATVKNRRKVKPRGDSNSIGEFVITKQFEESVTDLLDVPAINSRGLCIGKEVDPLILRPNTQEKNSSNQSRTPLTTDYDPNVSVMRVRYRSVSAQKTCNQAPHQEAKSHSSTFMAFRRVKAALEIPLRQPKMLWRRIQKRFYSKARRLSGASTMPLLGQKSA